MVFYGLVVFVRLVKPVGMGIRRVKTFSKLESLDDAEWDA